MTINWESQFVGGANLTLGSSNGYITKGISNCGRGGFSFKHVMKISDFNDLKEKLRLSNKRETMKTNC